MPKNFLGGFVTFFVGMGQHFSTYLTVVARTAASVVAGGVGSAIGLAVAYPIDVLKTKAQVTVSTEGKANESVLERARNILRQEGIAGFYGGVKTAMIGKAFTSSISFGANQLGIGMLNATNFLGGGVGGRKDGTPFVTLLLAACFAGFVETFINCPIGKFGIGIHCVESRPCAIEGWYSQSRFIPKKERVKVMMQAQENHSLYANEQECIRSILQSEGWFGLLTRGFGPTLAREVPSNAIYFVVYGLLMQTAIKDTLGIMAPMVCGAISGMACWIPVYPIDVVKTRMQNTKGGPSAIGKPASAIGVAILIYKNEGIGAFFNGIGLLILRAAVSNGITFWVYDLIMGSLGYT